MWFTLLTYYMFFSFLVTPALCHIPEHETTPKTDIDKCCILAESCMHDTIRVCGQRGKDKRTFLDFCDLLEYGCDTREVYEHIEDEDDCPKAPEEKEID